MAAGDEVLATGTASESFGLTAIGSVTVVDICGTGSVAAAAYDLPRPVGTTFEPVEGVLLTFPEPLAATEHFQLGRFGEVAVSSDGRLFQPTDRVAPGPEAQAMADLQRPPPPAPRRRVQRPEPGDGALPHPGGGADRRRGVRGHRGPELRLQPVPPGADGADHLRPHEPAAGGARPGRRRRPRGQLQHAELLHDPRRRQPERTRRGQRRGVRSPAGEGGGGDRRHRRRRPRPHGGREQRPDGDRQPGRRPQRGHGTGHLRRHHRAGAQPAERVRGHLRHRRHQGGAHLPTRGGHPGRPGPELRRPRVRPPTADPDLRAHRRRGAGHASSSTTSSRRTARPGPRPATRTRATVRAASTPAGSPRPKPWRPPWTPWRRRTC